MKVITKYILKEIVPNFFIGLAFFSLIMIIIEIFKLVSLNVEKNVPLVDVAQLFIFTLPYTFALTIPVGVLVGTLLAIGRLSSDSEITAMRANGISLFKVFIPTFLFGLILSVAHVAFFEYVLPWGNSNYVITRIQITKTNPTVELTENNAFVQNNISIQADGVDSETKELEIVRITDSSRNGHILYAQRGIFKEKDYAKNAYPLELYNVSTYPYIQSYRSTDEEETFEEKYNEMMILYIEDTLDNTSQPQGSKIDSISELYQKIDIWYAEKVNKYIETIHRFTEKIMELDYEIYKRDRLLESNPNIENEIQQIADINRELSGENGERTAAYRNTGEALQALANQIEEEGEEPNTLEEAQELEAQRQAYIAQIFAQHGLDEEVNEDEQVGEEGDPNRINFTPEQESFRQTEDKINNLRHLVNNFEREFEHQSEITLDLMIKERLYEFTKKFSIPFACLAFTLIGAPLGVFSKRSGKTMGLGFSIIIVFIWYGLLIVGNVAWKKDLMNPVFAAWLMDIVIIIAGLYFMFNRIKA